MADVILSTDLISDDTPKDMAIFKRAFMKMDRLHAEYLIRYMIRMAIKDTDSYLNSLFFIMMELPIFAKAIVSELALLGSFIYLRNFLFTFPHKRDIPHREFVDMVDEISSSIERDIRSGERSPNFCDRYIDEFVEFYAQYPRL